MIHPSAIIDKSAIIADDVEIGPFSIIGEKVEIQSGTWIGPHVVLSGPTKIGKNNKIYQFASIGDAPQDLKYAGEDTVLEIGDNNTIREYCTMNRGTPEGGGLTKVGNDNLFMAYTHVAHDCQIGNHTVFANAASLAGHVEVDDHAIIGGFTCVHQFTKIGTYSFSGLGTVVNRDIPPYCIVAGNHAKAYGINKNGLRRHDFSEETIRKLNKAFCLLVKSKGERAQLVAKVEEIAKDSVEVGILLAFITGSKRGIVR
jgi:UDP-N-acetylglucosamine acyltransferase